MSKLTSKLTTVHSPLTQDELKALVSYDPETGVFVRHVYPVNTKHRMGMQIGGADSYGYLRAKINRRIYKLHHLAWLYVYGEWPSSEIDHINRIKTDNRISNLRLATRSEQVRNSRRWAA